MKKIKAVFKIIRPVNFFIVFLSVIVASLICMKENYPVLIIFAAAFSAGLAAAAGNIINDIFDINIDRINRPKRPLPAQIISLKGAYLLYGFLVAMSLITASAVNLIALLVVLFTDIILFFYSYKIKSVPLLGNGVVAIMTGTAFIYGGIAVNNVPDSILPASFAFMINLIREIVKDMEDVTGDIANNIYTIPSKIGDRPARYLILVLSILLIAATAYPIATNLYKKEYFFVIIILVNPLLIFSIIKLFSDNSLTNLGSISFMLKLAMILGLAAIYLGK